MRPFSSLFLSAALLAACVYGQCANMYQRREWRTLSNSDRTRFINAVKQSKQPMSDGISFYDKVVHLHVARAGEIHNTANFFPWHRLYLFLFESYLRRVVDSGVALPYWNSAIDSQAPELAEFFDDDSSIGFGRNGQGRDMCILTGAFAGWQTTYPATKCLRRQWAETDRIGTLYGVDQIQNMMATSTNYPAFNAVMYRAPHAQLHNSIGGPVGDLTTMGSPNDPVFWLFHTFLDKLWADWQQLDSNGVMDYGGFNTDGTAASLNDALPGILAKNKNDLSAPAGPVPVSKVMDISKLCYQYVDLTPDVVSTSLPPAPSASQRRLWRRDGSMPNIPIIVKDKQSPIAAPHFCARAFINLCSPPQPIPSIWIRLNALNEDDMRSDEQKFNGLMIKGNTLPTYTSVSATWNQPKKLKKIITTVGTFKIFVRDESYTISFSSITDAGQAVVNLYTEVGHMAGTVQQDPTEIANEVLQILGPSLPKLAPINNGWNPQWRQNKLLGAH